MRITFSIFVAFATQIALTSAQPVKRQCQARLNSALSAAQRLQSHYWDWYSGGYSGGELWTDANVLEDLHNLMLADNSDAFSTVADDSYLGILAQVSSTPWNTVLGGSYDDAQWVILAFWKIADYKGARGEDNSHYLSSASTIYNIVASQWDTSTCGGGVWWSKDHTYKNAITNQLFLYTSADGYIRTGQQSYLDNANKAWAWLSSSGMRNSQGLWNDGLTSSCTNNGQTTWTYNQGVIASGLAALYSIKGDPSLLDQAEITLDATISHLSSNNILKESCDDATSSTCDADQQIFKGIWMKHVQYYLDNANSAARTAKYSAFLGSQASAIYHYGTSSTADIGSVWYAPSQGGSIFSVQSSTSGLAGWVSAAKYGPC